MDNVVTKFKRAYLKEYYHLNILLEIGLTKNGFYKLEIDNCRKLYESNDIEGYKKAKSSLPAVAFCGKFENGHSIKDLVEYNNLMILDIDGLTKSETTEIKSKLCKDHYIMALWISPSGLGLKGLIKIKSTPQLHKNLFNSIKKYLLENYTVDLDNSGSDITRLCYVSWDENLYLNTESLIYEDAYAINEGEKLVSKLTQTKSEGLVELNVLSTEKKTINRADDRILITKIIKYLSKRSISLTSDYENWVKVALTISNSFTYTVGEKYYIELCRIDGEKHNENKSINLLIKIYNSEKTTKDQLLTFASLVYMAKEKGYIVSKQKKEK